MSRFRWFLLLSIGVILFCSQQTPNSPSLPEPENSAAKAVQKLAGRYSALGNFDGSNAELKKLLKIYAQFANWREYANTLKAIAKNYDAKADYSNSSIYADLTIAATLKYLGKQDSLTGLAYKIKAESFMSTEQPDSSIYYFDRAAPILEKNACWEALAFIFLGKAINNYYSGNYFAMGPYLEQAYKVAEKHLPKSNNVFGLVFQLSGIQHEATGDFDKAIEWSQKSLNLYFPTANKTQLDSNSIANIYNNLGAIFASKGDYGEAIEYYQHATAWKVNDNKDKLALADFQFNLAVANMQLGEYADGIAHLEKAEIWLCSVPRKRVMKKYAILYGNYAACWANLDDDKKSLYYADLLLGIKGLDSLSQATAYRYKGKALAYRKCYAEAQAFFMKELDILSDKYGEYGMLVGPTYKSLGELAAKQNDCSLALDYHQKALACAGKSLKHQPIYANPSLDSIQVTENLIENLYGKADAFFLRYQKTGNIKDLTAADATFLLTVDAVDRMRREYLSEGSKRFLLKKSNAIFEKAIAASLEMEKRFKHKKYDEQAFLLAQKSKSILLIERMQDAEAKGFAKLPDSLLQRETQLKRDLSFYQNKLFEEKQKTAPDSLHSRVWQGKVFDLKRSLENLNDQLETSYPEYFEMKYKPNLPSVEAVQNQLLGKAQLYVEYFVGDSSMFIFSIGQPGFTVFSFDKPDKFEAQVSEFQQALSNPPTGPQALVFQSFVKPAHELYELLLDPVLKAAPHNHNLLIVPHGVVSYIPFEALLTSPSEAGRRPNYGNLPYLFQEYVVNYSYAAGLLLNLNHYRPDAIETGCLAFAPSYGHETSPSPTSGRTGRMVSGATALPGAQREVQLVAKSYPGDFLYSEKATESTFKLKAPNYRLLHLAMHGSANPENPLYSKLQFAENADTTEDGTLHAYEIYNLRLAADLVVLSACETGVGKFVHGEGVMSIAQGFLHTGVPAVAMSLWEAQDESTATLMGDFYEGLSNGLPKDEAMRNAKLQYLADASSMKHPFFWAGFVTIGDNAPLQHRNWAPWASTAALLLGFGSWMLYRRRLRLKAPSPQ